VNFTYIIVIRVWQYWAWFRRSWVRFYSIYHLLRINHTLRISSHYCHYLLCQIRIIEPFFCKIKPYLHLVFQDNCIISQSTIDHCKYKDRSVHLPRIKIFDPICQSSCIRFTVEKVGIDCLDKDTVGSPCRIFLLGLFLVEKTHCDLFEIQTGVIKPVFQPCGIGCTIESSNIELDDTLLRRCRCIEYCCEQQ